MRRIEIITCAFAIIAVTVSGVLAQHPSSAPQSTQESHRSRPGRASASAPHQAEAQVKAEPITVKLARGGKVAISSRSGQIILSGWDRDVVQASATSAGVAEPIETQTTGDAAHQRLLLVVPATSSHRPARDLKLDIKVPRYADVETLQGSRCSIEITGVDGTTLINPGNGDVKITRLGPVKVSRFNGDVTAREIKGDFTARTYHGDIVADAVTGAVDVVATSGDVTVRNGGGDVRASAATGDVDVHCAKGRIDATSASGSISLVGAGGDVEASTASGRVTFTGIIHKGGNYRLKSLNGPVEMTIQSDAPGFTATLSTYSGGLETEFPLKLESPVQRGPVNQRLIGTFGDGQAKISLDSFSGAVKIGKANAALLKECR